MLPVMTWWAIMLVTGLAVFPLTQLLFRHFTDRGWIFSKTLGLFLLSLILWILNVAHLVRFNRSGLLIVLIILALLCYGIRFFFIMKKKGSAIFPKTDLNTVILCAVEELLFLALFGIAVYIIGFKPEAMGTEKFMDYGFLTSLARSRYMPFADTWFGGEPINYYYGGQYITGVLMRFSGSTAGQSYNLMRALITAMSFILPFSLVWQLTRDRTEKKAESWLAATLSGIAVAFCGNMHYVIYGLIKPWLADLKGEYLGYWFPDSTRFIGYDPDIPDKTIHEFPCYSSVLGDLHAHYVNILFVITVTAIVYAWAQVYTRSKKPVKRKELLCLILNPFVILIGIMTGTFRWTNFWDFPIYYVVCGSIFFFVLLEDYWQDLKRFIVIMLGIALVMFVTGWAAALPFTLKFDQISSEVARTWSHTSFYQLMVLWGLPAGCLLLYVISLITETVSARKARGTAAGNDKKLLSTPDLAVLMFALCAAGLVFLPEVIYVKDIYSEAHYRANTMFKLTYQAFILFGISMPYILIRSLKLFMKNDSSETPEIKPVLIWLSRILAVCGIILLLLTGGFLFTSIHAWFGDVRYPEFRVNTDASVFVSESFPDDFAPVNWINSTIGGQPVMLEAPGDSYSDYERISVATGLPTIIGWRVHEWLWRSDLAAVDQRIADVERIYTSEDSTEVQELLRKYNVSYIYVGTLEYEKYPGLQDGVLRDLGDIVYDDGTTYIVKVDVVSP